MIRFCLRPEKVVQLIYHCSSCLQEGGSLNMPALFIFNLVQLLLLYLACLCSCACLLSSIEQSRSEQEKVKHFWASRFLISDRLCTISQECCRHPKQVLLIPFVVHDSIFECILLNICYMCYWKYVCFCRRGNITCLTPMVYLFQNIYGSVESILDLETREYVHCCNHGAVHCEIVHVTYGRCLSECNQRSQESGNVTHWKPALFSNRPKVWGRWRLSVHRYRYVITNSCPLAL